MAEAVRAPAPASPHENNDQEQGGEDPQDADDDNPQDGVVEVGNKAEGGNGATAKAKPKVMKSAEARARDERLAANYVQYEHMSNEELEKVVPKNAEGSPTSIGAMLHHSELCAVCIFHHSPKGCYNGVRCRFCHGDHEQPQRLRRRGKRAQEGGSNTADSQPTQSEGSRQADKDSAIDTPRKLNLRRKMQRLKRKRGPGDGDEGDGAPDKVQHVEYGSAWEAGPTQEAESNTNASHDQATDNSDCPLDECGNSRPSWLRDDEGPYSASGYNRPAVMGAYPGQFPFGPPAANVPYGAMVWNGVSPQHAGGAGYHYSCGWSPQSV